MDQSKTSSIFCSNVGDIKAQALSKLCKICKLLTSRARLMETHGTTFSKVSWMLSFMSSALNLLGWVTKKNSKSKILLLSFWAHLLKIQIGLDLSNFQKNHKIPSFLETVFLLASLIFTFNKGRILNLMLAVLRPSHNNSNALWISMQMMLLKH